MRSPHRSGFSQSFCESPANGMARGVRPTVLNIGWMNNRIETIGMIRRVPGGPHSAMLASGLLNSDRSWSRSDAMTPPFSD